MRAADPALLRVRLHLCEHRKRGDARSLLDWHVNNRYCARCGGGTSVVRGGWGRHCTVCGVEHFPRVEPTVIMLVEFVGSALICRQAFFPRGRYSALSGFVGPGTTIEVAVARVKSAKRSASACPASAT